MANKNAEAFPTASAMELGDTPSLQGGLSKREYAAIHILVGLVTREGVVGPKAMQELPVKAVKLADTLLEAL